MRWAVFFCCSFTKGSLPKNWQGGQDSNLQQLVLETGLYQLSYRPIRGLSGYSSVGLWQRQKRQYLLSSSRSVVFCLFFCVL